MGFECQHTAPITGSIDLTLKKNFSLKKQEARMLIKLAAVTPSIIENYHAINVTIERNL